MEGEISALVENLVQIYRANPSDHFVGTLKISEDMEQEISDNEVKILDHNILRLVIGAEPRLANFGISMTFNFEDQRVLKLFRTEH